MANKSKIETAIALLKRSKNGLHPHELKAKTGMARTFSQWDMRNLEARTGLKLVIRESAEGWFFYRLTAKA